MKKYFWVIERYDGTKLVAQYKIPHGQMTRNNINNLLRTLVAKHELSDEEIIPCFLKRNTKKYSDYLEVKHDAKAKYYSLYCQGKIEIIALYVPEERLSEVIEDTLQK